MKITARNSIGMLPPGLPPMLSLRLPLRQSNRRFSAVQITSRGNVMAKKYTRQDLRDAAEKYKNWGKWGPNDEIGTLNYTSAEDIVAATRLVKKGKVISLALNFDYTGPQGAK